MTSSAGEEPAALEDPDEQHTEPGVSAVGADARYAARGLNAGDFRRIAVQGFGESENSYPHSMAWFRDALYVGTTRHVLTMTKKLLQIFERDPPMCVWPVYAPEDTYQLDLRAQVWRYDVHADRWTKVFTAPTAPGSKGRPVPRSIGFRGMFVFPRHGEGVKSALYVASTGGHELPESPLFRSFDGENFEIASIPRLAGSETPRAYRHFTEMDGKVFTSPVAGAKRGQGNRPGVMTVMVTSDPSQEEWQLACEPYFGDPTNGSVMCMAVFAGHLYAATLNIPDGFQLWRTEAKGNAPYAWHRVLTHGAHRGRLNQMGMTMQTFRDHLYIGTGIQNGGHDQDNRVGPAAAEVLRVDANGSWDVVAGEARRTPDGLKVPLSGYGPGFNNPQAGYIWQMCEHDGWLYLGTAVRTIFMWYADWDRLADRIRKPPRDALDRFLATRGGCSLWRTRNGVDWLPVTQNGFGNPYNYGVRTMVSTRHGLFVGLANPFAPEVAVRRVAGWRYEPNEQGGLQVLLGCAAEDDVPRADEGASSRVVDIARPVRRLRAWPGSARSRRVEELLGDFYGGTEFRFVGLWRASTRAADDACENLLADVVAFLPERGGAVLDVDCGRGASTRYLARCFAGGHVVGTTAHHRDLRYCRRLAPEASFVRRSAPALPFAAARFDYVVWLEGPLLGGRTRARLREILRVLRPGGRLVLSDIVDPERGVRRARSSDPAVADARQYEEFLRDVGFGDVRVEDVTLASWLPFRQRSSLFLHTRCGAAEERDGLVALVSERLRKGARAESRYVLGSAVKPADGRS